MRYLRKSLHSKIIKQGCRYATQHHRPQIRNELLKEQQNFCAYTERYIEPVDACDIEHFDERKKSSDDDSYWNWYAVHHWINLRKRSIEHFLPILSPYDETLADRVCYRNGEFQAVNLTDHEALHLIEFLGWNDPTLAAYRAKTVARIKDLRTLFDDDDAMFLAYITARPEYLSFISVLEVEFGLPLR